MSQVKKKMTKQEFERQKKEFETRRDMQQLAFNSLSLDEVMKMCGYSGEPAGAQHLKYKVNGILFNCEKNGKRFGFPNGDALSFTGKKGGIGALNLFRAVNEVEGNVLSYPDACTLLAREVCPESLDTNLSISDEDKKRLELKRAEVAKKAAKEAAAAEAEKEKKRLHWNQLPPYSAKHEHMALRYLHENRKFPKGLAKSLLEARVLYPAHIKNKLGFKQTHIIAPIVEIGTSEACGYADITLGVQKGKDITEYDSIKKTFAHNEGLPTRGVTVISGINDKTKKITICESLLDGIAYGQLKGFPKDECIVSTAGVRVPEPTINYCKEQGLEVKTALDNDIAGRRFSKKIEDYCQSIGVPSSMEFPKDGRIELSFDKENSHTAGNISSIKTACQQSKLDFQLQEDPSGSKLQATLPNTRTVCRALNSVLVRMERLKLKKEDRPIQVAYHRKDWNDLLKEDMAKEIELENRNLDALQKELADPKQPVRTLDL